MKCYYHPEVDAVAICADCGKAICQRCVVNVNGRFLCRQCLAYSGTSARGQGTENVLANFLAVASLVLGILGLLGYVCGGCVLGGAMGIVGILFGLPGSITGWIARKQLLQEEDGRHMLQVATIGLVLGGAECILGIVALALTGVLLLSELLRQ